MNLENYDFEVNMSKKKIIPDYEIKQDENFYYVSGYTSSGFPYGITWEEFENDSDDEEDENDIIF